MGHICSRFSAPLPVNTLVRPKKSQHKSLFPYELPVIALFLLLCTRNASYPQQNKDPQGEGVGCHVQTRLATRLHCAVTFSTSSGLP